MPRLSISTRTLATTALAGTATFPALVAMLHVVQRGSYHPLSQAVSELALGRGGWLMTVAFSAAGCGALCLAALLRRTVSRALVAPGLLLVCAGLTFVSAAFHADGDGPTTAHGEIHQAAGVSMFLLVIVAMFVCWRAFRRDVHWRPLSRPTLVWAVVGVCGFLATPAVGDAYFGVAQRAFLAVWISWVLTVAARGRTAPDVRAIAASAPALSGTRTRAAAGSGS